LVPHQDAPHSAISLDVAFKRLKIKHFLKGKLPRTFLVGFERRNGNLEPFRENSLVKYDLKVTELAFDRKSVMFELHTTIGFM